MGSEQSSQGNTGEFTGSEGRPTRLGQLRRGKSVPEQKRPETENVDGSRPGSCSPGLSVCSDSDLPYISYTVNRPIGDSPKLPAKQAGQLSRGKSHVTGASVSQNRKGPFRKVLGANKPSTIHSIVVVKSAVKEETSDTDSDLLRLQSTPMFLPIMRGTLHLPAARDPEVLERLDPGPLYKICLRCQSHLYDCATSVNTEQNYLMEAIKESNIRTNQVLQHLGERYKTYFKKVEALSKVTELASQIGKCHVALNKTLESLERLNNLLPPAERMEPFVWTTG